MYHPERLWGVTFAFMTIAFAIDTYLIIKGIRKKRIGLFDVLISLGVPFLILLMLTDDQLTIGARITDSFIAFICVVTGIVHIYVLRKKMPQNKKEQ